MWLELTLVLASMNLRMKIRPAGMTFAAKDNFPISDSNAHFVHLVRVLNVCSLCKIAVSLSGGMLATPATISSFTPRKVRQVVGEVRF